MKEFCGDEEMGEMKHSRNVFANQINSLISQKGFIKVKVESHVTSPSKKSNQKTRNLL
jgi:microsomal dipeptidase-like Zn-dependent dipeptidase